jgi:hypothetical protein
MLKNALERVEDIPDDWAEKVGPHADTKAIGPADAVKRRKGALSYECPSCGEPI